MLALRVSYPRAAIIVAAVVQFIEAVAGSLMLVRTCERGTHLVNILLMVAFTVAQGNAIASGMEGSCGCFGPMASAQIGPSTLAVPVTLALLSLTWMVSDGAAPAATTKMPAKTE